MVEDVIAVLDVPEELGRQHHSHVIPSVKQRSQGCEELWGNPMVGIQDADHLGSWDPSACPDVRGKYLQEQTLAQMPQQKSSCTDASKRHNRRWLRCCMHACPVSNWPVDCQSGQSRSCVPSYPREAEGKRKLKERLEEMKQEIPRSVATPKIVHYSCHKF